MLSKDYHKNKKLPWPKAVIAFNIISRQKLINYMNYLIVMFKHFTKFIYLNNFIVTKPLSYY